MEEGKAKKQLERGKGKGSTSACRGRYGDALMLHDSGFDPARGLSVGSRKKD